MSKTEAFFKRQKALKEDPEAPLRRILAKAIDDGSTLSNPELFKRTLAALERLKALEATETNAL